MTTPNPPTPPALIDDLEVYAAAASLNAKIVESGHDPARFWRRLLTYLEDLPDGVKPDIPTMLKYATRKPHE